MIKKIHWFSLKLIFLNFYGENILNGVGLRLKRLLAAWLGKINTRFHGWVSEGFQQFYAVVYVYIDLWDQLLEFQFF